MVLLVDRSEAMKLEVQQVESGARQLILRGTPYRTLLIHVGTCHGTLRKTVQRLFLHVIVTRASYGGIRYRRRMQDKSISLIFVKKSILLCV